MAPAAGREELMARYHGRAGTLEWYSVCLLYTSDAADERSSVDLGGRRIIKKKKVRDLRGSGADSALRRRVRGAAGGRRGKMAEGADA